MSKLERSELVRLILLGLVVVLESLAVLSVVLHTQLFPSGSIYPNIISVAVFVLPALVGLLARRIETAVLLAVLPFWLMGVIYLAIYAPVWNIDLFSLGVLVSRVAGTTVFLAVFGLLGWLLRRIFVGRKATSVKLSG